MKNESISKGSRDAKFSDSLERRVPRSRQSSCGGESPTSPSDVGGTATTTTTTTTGAAGCAVTPTETIGPYPSLVDLFRSDIREGKSGTTLTLKLRVVNANSACAVVPDANVEIWHVDAAGNYSQYGSQTGQTYLRGIQTTDANGEVTFTTIYPGWYQGRATHIHIEVTIGRRLSQGHADRVPGKHQQCRSRQRRVRVTRHQPVSNRADGIFADSLDSELVTPTGDPASGYTAAFTIGVAL